MTVVVDIDCPACGSDDVEKAGIASYRCRECGAEFDRGDIGP